jgi:hypothetical protein
MDSRQIFNCHSHRIIVLPNCLGIKRYILSCYELEGAAARQQRELTVPHLAKAKPRGFDSI